MAQNLYKRGDTYWWRAMIDGKTYRRSTGHTDFKLAQDKARDFDKAVRSGEDAKVAMPTFGEWVLKYLAGAAKLRKGAVDRDPPLLRPAVRAWGDKPLDKIKRSDCESLLVGMLGVGNTFGTVWLRCIRIKLMFRLAVDDGLLLKSPWAGIKVPTPSKRARVLSREEQETLREKLGPRWSRFVTVAVGTGLRRSEMMNLTPAHRVAGALHLTADICKGSKARTVPLRPEVEAALDAQTPPDSLSRYWPCEHKTPAAVLRRMAVSLGWPRLTVHDLRRTFGTRCAEAGMPLPHLQKIMGHSSPTITAAYYVHLGESSVRDSLLNLPLK